MTRESANEIPRDTPQIAWQDAAGAHTLEIRDAKTSGSATHCELVIADRAVSRIHFELTLRGDGLWAVDLGSRNGTYVNGIRLAEARIPHGAVLRVGTTDITVSYGPSEAPIEEWPDTSFGPLVGASTVMREAFAKAARLAESDVSIIIEGEPGTGKKALARAIHDRSRPGAPFVVLECATLPSHGDVTTQLAEAFRSAEGGTLVLDDPGELPIAVQRQLSAVDGRNFRVVASTARDLRRLVNEGAFRESLYFRLANATIRLPPLRSRPGDLGLLLAKFVEPRRDLATAQLVAELERLPWMGNVQELRVHADRLRAGDLVVATPLTLEVGDSEDLRRARRLEATLGTMEVPTLESLLASADPPLAEIGRMLPPVLEPWYTIGFKEFRERWIDLGEREYLRRLMNRTSRSSGAASREAGLERTYLYRLLKKHGV